MLISKNILSILFLLTSCLPKFDRQISDSFSSEPSNGFQLAEEFKNDRYGPIIAKQVLLYSKFDQAMKEIGFFDQGFMHLEPQLISTALKRYRIENFIPKSPTGKSLHDLFSLWKNSGVDFSPMFKSLRHAAVLQNPAMVDFLDKAFEYGWLKNIDKQLIKNAMASTMILEVLTVSAINSNQFGREIYLHYYKELQGRGVDSSSLVKSIYSLKNKLGIFPAAKFISITPGIVGSVIKGLNKGIPFKDEKEFREKLKILEMPVLNSLEYKYAWHYGELDQDDGSNLGLRINIAEATIADYKSGQTGNSRSGAAMMIWAEINRTHGDWYSGPLLPVHSHGISKQIYNLLDFDSVAEDRSNYINRTHLSEDFVSVYETWNASFVLNEFGGDDLLFLSWLWPKLFIPSTLSSTGANYLTARIWSLWLAGIQHILNKIDEEKESSTKTDIETKEKIREMALTWGNINRNYSRILFSVCTPFSNANANIWYRKWIKSTGTIGLLSRAVFNKYPSIIPKKLRAKTLEKNLDCLKNLKESSKN